MPGAPRRTPSLFPGRAGKRLNNRGALTDAELAHLREKFGVTTLDGRIEAQTITADKLHRQNQADYKQAKEAREALERVFGMPLTANALAALETVVSLMQNGL